MVFKRRDRRSVWQTVIDFVYPRGGWARAAQYVKHRLRRLPDTPEKISRGVWAGVFTAFTPFYGLHFIVAAIIAKLMRGNILAGLMATFFGNPLTYVPIGVVSLETGYRMLGIRQRGDIEVSLGGKFAKAGSDLWHNFISLFTPSKMDWRGLSLFYDEVFFPYLVGGIIPGIICATFCYYVSVPLIAAYQKRRRNALRNKLAQLQKKTANPDDA
ncbi:MAG: DUF2062 domain-containing protein [Pseudomonadota bacterium]